MMTNTLIWHTEQRKVNDLVPHTRNPRVLSDRQADALKKSLERFGLVEIPAINLNGTILAGHQRVKLLQLLGRGEELIDVRIPNRKLTKDEAEKYLLTSNAVTADWDWDLLRSFDAEILLDIGFSDEDLSHIWDDALEVEDDEFNVEKELAAITKPTVKPGELYALGPHRLICADSQNLDAIKRLVGSAKIDLVNFDPPYNINLSYDKGISGKKNYGGKTNDKKSDAEYRAFLKALIGNALAVAKDDAHFFVWCDQNFIGFVQALYDELGIERKRVCSWIKNNQNPTPMVAFNKATESCVYGTRGKPYLADRVQTLNEILNKQVGSGARLIDDIMDLFEIWLVKRLPGQSYEHPTEKPPSLHEKALRRCSKPGDTLLDLTAGSGSLMVAAESLKRRAFLSEVDPVFATLILKRYEKFIGKKPKKLTN
jgi:site-specific DNA-methyltransferase (adenine-specific)